MYRIALVRRSKNSSPGAAGIERIAAHMPDALSDLVPDPQDAPPLNWGILAPGGIANKLAEAVGKFTAGTVVAVGSRDAGRAADFAGRHGITRSYGSYAELGSGS